MPAEDVSPVRRLVLLRFYLPRVLASDGTELAAWAYARALVELADTTLQENYRHHSQQSLSEWPPELAELVVGIKILEQLRGSLLELQREDPQHLNQYADWYRIKAKLRRVMPLVERLLTTADRPSHPVPTK